MKKSLLFSLALCGSLSGFAQLGYGDVAPDFTVQAMNAGNITFNLYNELNANHPVIFDVSATWCGPCWNYHSTGKLEQLYETYGPHGTDELRVIWIDGDADTPDNTMYSGTGAASGKNWIVPTPGDTVPFPMANPPANVANSIGSGYRISAFPTLYVICPNRSIQTFPQSASVTDIYNMAKACPVLANKPIDVAPFSYSGSAATCGDLAVSAKIQNVGTTPLTTATLTAKRGNTVLGTHNWTGNLASMGVTAVSMGTLPFGQGSDSLRIEVTTPNDGNLANDLMRRYITGPVDQDVIQYDVKVKLDAYANETSFKIKKSNGSTVFSKQYGTADNNKSYEYTLPDLVLGECYVMEVKDAFGDGIFSNGYVRLFRRGETSQIFSASGTFTDRYYAFNVGAQSNSIEENEAGQLFTLYPNPSTDVLNTSLNLTNSERVTFRVVNAQGQTVYTENVQMAAGTSVYPIQVSGLAAGIYSLQVTSGKQVFAKAFIKQ